MILNHFTSELHLGFILGSGVLMVTESNIGSARNAWPPTGDHVGPDVVWFTVRDDAIDCGLESARAHFVKGGVKVVCDLPDADCAHWPEWAQRHGIHPKWYDQLTNLAGSDADPSQWWVVDRPVPWTEWR